MTFSAQFKKVLQRYGGVVLLLLLNAVVVCSGIDLPREYHHQIWRSEEGLLDPVVRQIIQSQDGYLWLATEESLTRFDGVRFTEINHKTNSDKVDRWFTALTESKDGTIWYSHPNGGLGSYKNGQQKLYRMRDGLPSNYIMSLCEDREGTLWIGTSVGLSCFTNNTFVNYTNGVPGLLQSSVRAIMEDHQGNLWIGTAVGISKKTGNLFVTLPTRFAANPSTMSLYEDPEHRVWIGTAKGLTLYENGVSTHYNEDDGLAHGTVRTVVEDHLGNVWVGTSGGLQRFVDGELVAPVIHSSADFEDSISWVYSVTEDNEGNVWFGTNLGLNRFKAQRFQVLSKENGLGNNMASLVYQDRTGTKWVGTYGGGLTRIKNGEVTTLTTVDGLPSNYILALCEDHEGTLWIGTDGAGLVRYRDGKFTQYLQSKDIRMNTVRVIYEDKKGNLWIGSNSSIGRFKDGTFENENMTIVFVRSLLETSDGSLWVGSRTGLMQWKDGIVNTNAFTRKDGLGGTAINALYEDSNGALWIGTDAAGLTHYKDGKFIAFGTKEGFPNERILHMLDDGYGNLWMSTRNGILSANKKALNDLVAGNISEITLLSLGKKDGLKRAQCNGFAQPSGWKMDDGSLWFPTVYGSVALNPREVAVNTKPPSVVIENISVDGKPVTLASSIVIPPGHGNVEIEFAGLSFEQAERVRFKYRLENFDSEWQDGDTRRSAVYKNLKPGEYDFHVIACNNDGVWNETGAMVSFELRPHFYQRSSFYAGVILLIGFTIFAIYRFRVRHLQRHQETLAALVEERTRALQQEIMERKQAEEALRKSQEMVLRQERLAVVGQLAAGIAHEFNNILTVVQGHTCLLLSDDNIGEKEKEPLERISVAAERAANLTKQLLTFSRKQMMQIRPLNLNEVVSSMTAMLKRVLGEHIFVEFDYCPQLPLICADAGMMEQIVINLAVNARDALPEKGGHLTIRVLSKEVKEADKEKNPDARPGVFACLEVADTGSGIPAENMKKIFEPFFTTKDVGKGTGLGLATVYGIVKQHQGWIEVESEVGRGTKFSIFIPVAGKAQTKADLVLQ